MNTIEARIQEDILLVMRETIYKFQFKHRKKPKGLALGPEEFINFEMACSSRLQMRYDSIEKWEFEGVKLFCAPINGIMILGTHDEIYPSWTAFA